MGSCCSAQGLAAGGAYLGGRRREWRTRRCRCGCAVVRGYLGVAAGSAPRCRWRGDSPASAAARDPEHRPLDRLVRRGAGLQRHRWRIGDLGRLDHRAGPDDPRVRRSPARDGVPDSDPSRRRLARHPRRVARVAVSRGDRAARQPARQGRHDRQRQHLDGVHRRPAQLGGRRQPRCRSARPRGRTLVFLGLAVTGWLLLGAGLVLLWDWRTLDA